MSHPSHDVETNPRPPLDIGSSSTNGRPDDEKLLANLEERYIDSLLAGRELDAEELITQHPDLGDVLRPRLRLAAAMYRSAAVALSRSEATIERSTSSEACPSSSETFSHDYPEHIGRFQVVRIAGRGAFGLVLEARDTELHRRVAIKVPHGMIVNTAEDRERFLREARTAANLRHPSIVPVYEIGESQGQPYIVSEYIEGSTLAEIATRSRLTPSGAALLVRKIADALASAHAEGVVHRDIKPGNILIDEGGEPHVTDFGLARIASEQSLLTTEGQLLGTPAYMAPEQAAGHVDRVDARSDVYSLGVVLYELLTGESPFRGAPHMVIQQVIREEPRAPRALDDRIPRDLETICLRAMAKEAHRRFPSAQELADDLERFLSHQPIRSRRVGQFERLAQWCRRNPFVAALLSVVVSLLLAICGLSVWGYLRESAIRAQADRRRERTEELLGSLVTQADRHGFMQTHSEDVERNLYHLSIEAADRLWRLGDFSRAKEVLARYGAVESSKDWRGWEWFHLQAKTEGLEAFCEVVVGSDVDAVADHPDGNQQAFGAAERIFVWNARERGLVSAWDARRVKGSPLVWNADATRLASIRTDGSIDLWNPATLHSEANLPILGEQVLALAWDRQGRLQAASRKHHALLIWDAANPGTGFTWLPTDGEQRAILAAAWSADCEQLAVGCATGDIVICKRTSADDWSVRSVLKAEGRTPVSLAWSPDHQRLASAGADDLVKVWDVSEQIALVTLDEVAEPVTGLSWNLTGHRLTGFTKSGRVFQWTTRPDQKQVLPWTSIWHQALLAANRQDWDVLRRLCREIRDWAGRGATDSLEARERLRALKLSADLLQTHDLLADAIATSEQILAFDVSRLPVHRMAEVPAPVIAARRIDEAVRRLLSETELSRQARADELEQLLDDLFPYGRTEIPIPFRVRPADSVAPLWQLSQIVIELARATGELDRLRAEWERHPHQDSLPMRALQFEASAAAGDHSTTDRLLKATAANGAMEPLPLWSEGCLLEATRRGLSRATTGFGEFSLSDESVRPYVQRTGEELRITAPVNGGDLKRLGVVRRRPITGDFELAMDFQINEFQPPSRVVGLYLQLDLLEGGEMLHFGRSLSNDVGHELVAYQSQVTKDEEFRTRMWRFPSNLVQGRLMLARNGGTMYWLFSERADEPARVIHAQSCPTTDVAAIWVFVDYRTVSTQSRVDVVCRNLSLRTE